MECPKCGFCQTQKNAECQKCGIVFSKLEKVEEPDEDTDFLVEEEAPAEPRSAVQIAADLFFDMAPYINDAFSCMVHIYSV